MASAYEYITPGFVESSFDFFEGFEKLREGEYTSRDFERAASRAVLAPLPYGNFWRHLRQAGDQTKRVIDTDYPDAGVLTRIADTIVKDFVNTVPVPGYTPGLPPHRNIFGDVIHYPTGGGPTSMFNIIETTLPEDSPAVQEMARLGLFESSAFSPSEGETRMSVTMPSKTIQKSHMGQSITVRMTPKEYDRLVLLTSGQDLMAFGGVPLREALDSMVKDNYPTLLEGYKTDQAKRVAMVDLIRRYKTAARKQFEWEQQEAMDRVDQQKQYIENARGMGGMR
jgi:hypothetical protein